MLATQATRGMNKGHGGGLLQPPAQTKNRADNRQQSRRRTVKNAMRNLQKHFSNQPF